MIQIHLEPETERQLRHLAASRQEDVAEVVRRAVEEYLDVQAWGDDTAEDWADASIALLPEVLDLELP